MEELVLLLEAKFRHKYFSQNQRLFLFLTTVVYKCIIDYRITDQALR